MSDWVLSLIAGTVTCTVFFLVIGIFGYIAYCI